MLYLCHCDLTELNGGLSFIERSPCAGKMCLYDNYARITVIVYCVTRSAGSVAALAATRANRPTHHNATNLFMKAQNPIRDFCGNNNKEVAFFNAQLSSIFNRVICLFAEIH
jgi:hypothetical protein